MSINPIDIVIIKKFGEGSFGIAFTATYEGQPVIVKKLKTDVLRRDFCKEILLLKYLNEQGTVKYYGSYIDVDKSPCVVIEQFGQSIYDEIIVAKKKLTPSQYQTLFGNLIKSFIKLHERGVIHNDIKVANILMDISLNVKIIDFGLAEYVGLTPLKSLMSYYQTTEIIQDPQGIKGFQSESYSIGVTLIHILLRNYYVVSIGVAQGHILLDGVDRDDDFYDSRMGFGGANMVKSLIRDRLPLTEVIKHPYFNNPSIIYGGSLVLNNQLLSQRAYTSIYSTLSKDAYLNYPYLDATIANLSQNTITYSRPSMPDDLQHQAQMCIIVNGAGIPSFSLGKISFNALINSIIYSQLNIEPLTANELTYQFMGCLYTFSSIDMYKDIDIKRAKNYVEPFVYQIALNPITNFIPVWDSIEYVLYHYQYAIAGLDSSNPVFIETFRNALMQMCLFFSLFDDGKIDFNEICQFVAGNVNDYIKPLYLTKIETILSTYAHTPIKFDANDGREFGFVDHLMKNSDVELQQQYSHNKYELVIKEAMFPMDDPVRIRIHTVLEH